MQVIVIGCGRLGAELASSLQGEHQVTVVDQHREAFDRLGTHFVGRTIQGDGMDRDALLRAGIETADGLAAVTASDNVNAVVARIAQSMFGVERVVARLYNPRRESIYRKLNIQTISSSAWGAHRIEELLIQPELRRPASDGRWVWQSDE